MMTEGKTMQAMTNEERYSQSRMDANDRRFNDAEIARVVAREAAKVTLRCNECGKKRKVSPDSNYNERCPKCGGVDWDVL
jgi:hypothetical protein